MGEKPLEIKVNLNFELWFGETNNDQDWVIFGLLSFFMAGRQTFLVCFLRKFSAFWQKILKLSIFLGIFFPLESYSVRVLEKS